MRGLSCLPCWRPVPLRLSSSSQCHQVKACQRMELPIAYPESASVPNVLSAASCTPCWPTQSKEGFGHVQAGLF